MNSEDKIRELEAKLAELTARFEQAEHSRVVAREANELVATDADMTPTSSRRGMLKLAGAAAIGAVGVAVAGNAQPAAANNGDLMKLGQVGDGTVDVVAQQQAIGQTRHDWLPLSTGAGFLFQAGAANKNHDSEFPCALGGWTTSTPNPTGVYGRSTIADGNGVVGSGSAGVGVLGTGAVGVKATGVSTGVNAAASAGSGVLAVGTGGDGVFGLSAGGPAGSAAIRGVGGDFGVASNATTKANMYLQPNNNFLFGTTPKVVPSARTDSHRVGELENVDGDLWWCVVAGTPGTWRKISGPTVAGAFHAVTPGRVYDSRQALPTPGPLAAGANRTISVADRRDANLTTGAVVQADFVPAGATAVSANVTITGTVGAGFLTVNPGGNTTVGASTINWKADNQDIANGIILTLDGSRQLTIVAGGGGSTGFIIDINGYFL